MTGVINTMIECNLNNKVKVKLTEHGKSLWTKHVDEVFPLLEHADLNRRQKASLKPDDNGMVSFQLWDLMKVFGSACYCGAKNIFEDNKIYFDESDIKT